MSNGYSGNNGMQTYSVTFLMGCDNAHEYSKGHVVPCPHCGEEFQLKPENTFLESLLLGVKLSDEGCPFCNHRKSLTPKHLTWYNENVKKVLILKFEVEGGLELTTFRKPIGWKPLSKTALKIAWEDYKTMLEDRQAQQNQAA